jgi:hypothetical protein
MQVFAGGLGRNDFRIAISMAGRSASMNAVKLGLKRGLSEGRRLWPV